MKKMMGVLIALAFVISAQTAVGQAKSPPVVPEAKPAVSVVTPPPAKDPKTEATEVCKKKGVVGLALDECIKTELAKVPSQKPAEGKPEAAPKAK